MKYQANEIPTTTSNHNTNDLKLLRGCIFFSKYFDIKKTGAPRIMIGANITTTGFIHQKVYVPDFLNIMHRCLRRTLVLFIQYSASSLPFLLHSLMQQQ